MSDTRVIPTIWPDPRSRSQDFES